MIRNGNAIRALLQRKYFNVSKQNAIKTELLLIDDTLKVPTNIMAEWFRSRVNQVRKKNLFLIVGCMLVSIASRYYSFDDVEVYLFKCCCFLMSFK